MSEGRFIVALSQHDIPKEPRGRLSRFTFDVDTDAVHDFIMFDSKDSATPWPAAVIAEMVTTLSEWARREDFTARLLNRRIELSRGRGTIEG